MQSMHLSAGHPSRATEPPQFPSRISQEPLVDPSAFIASQELIRALEPHSTPVPCSQDRVLFCQGGNAAGIYILLSGSATLTMQSNSGHEVLRVEVRPGSVLGLPALIGNKPYSLTALAQTGAHAAFISRDDFTHLMAAEPLLSMKVLEILAAEVHMARKAIFDN